MIHYTKDILATQFLNKTIEEANVCVAILADYIAAAPNSVAVVVVVLSQAVFRLGLGISG